MSLNFLATRFQCSWPWDTLVLLCDGRFVCGCADPYAPRTLGDARTSSVHEVWTSHGLVSLRRELNAGGSKFCGDCALKRPLKKDESPLVRGIEAGSLPGHLYVECTAACNISCHEAVCAPETGITRTRQASMLDFELFCRVIDETGPSLGRIDFFNYGEAFPHKRAVEMCAYIKTHFPHIYVYTSTNGLAFSEEKARELVHSGIDEVTFSLDGATQSSYERYRRRGRLDVALRNLRAMADEKRLARRDTPFINWRYILFTWNDSDEEMSLARQLAAELGADRLCWEITDHPEEAFSRRFVPGSPDFESIRREIWDQSGLGNAIPGGTPRARIEVHTPFNRLPLLGRAGRPLIVNTRVHNLSTRPFAARTATGRRLVRLGAQLCQADGTLLERDFARASLAESLLPGRYADLMIEIPMPTRGRYRLKFDLACEGIDWLERCGSETTSKTLWVT